MAFIHLAVTKAESDVSTMNDLHMNSRNSFDVLLKSGIPLDWNTLLLGWDGFGEFYGMVRTDQLRSYAMDQIGYGLEVEYELVCAIAFAEERDTWTIRACLEQLASDTPEARNRAERVWRWVMLSDIVARLTQELAAALNPNAEADDPYALDVAAINVWVDLREFWSVFEFPSDRFSTALDWKRADWPSELWRMQAVLAEHREFLDRERTALQEAPNAHHP